MLKKIIAFIKKYFIDIIIQLGIFILTNQYLGIRKGVQNCNTLNPFNGGFCLSSAQIHSAQIKIFAIMLISVGINMAVRKYFRNEKV